MPPFGEEREPVKHEKRDAKSPETNWSQGVPSWNSVQLFFPLLRNILHAENEFDIAPVFEIIQSKHERAQEIQACASTVYNLSFMNLFFIKAVVHKIQTHDSCKTSQPQDTHKTTINTPGESKFSVLRFPHAQNLQQVVARSYHFRWARFSITYSKERVSFIVRGVWRGHFALEPGVDGGTSTSFKSNHFVSLSFASKRRDRTRAVQTPDARWLSCVIAALLCNNKMIISQLGPPVDGTKSVTKFQFPSQSDSFRHDRHVRYRRTSVQRPHWRQSVLTIVERWPLLGG